MMHSVLMHNFSQTYRPSRRHRPCPYPCKSYEPCPLVLFRQEDITNNVGVLRSNLHMSFHLGPPYHVELMLHYAYFCCCRHTGKYSVLGDFLQALSAKP